MSDHDVQMAAIATLNTKVEWCVSALKYLLGQQAGYQPEAPLEDYDDEVVEEAEGVVWTKPVEGQVCLHNQQALVNGNITCAKCGHVLVHNTGVGGAASQHGI